MPRRSSELSVPHRLSPRTTSSRTTHAMRWTTAIRGFPRQDMHGGVRCPDGSRPTDRVRAPRATIGHDRGSLWSTYTGCGCAPSRRQLSYHNQRTGERRAHTQRGHGHACALSRRVEVRTSRPSRHHAGHRSCVWYPSRCGEATRDNRRTDEHKLGHGP